MGWTVYNSDGKILQSAELADNAVTNAKVSSTAQIALSKLADLTTSRALVTDGNGDIIVSGVTTTELELLDGLTSSTAELNLLDGVTSTTAELNILDGVTSTAAELNKLDGASANVTAANLNILTDSSSTTALHLHAASGSLDSALTSFVRNGDYRSIYMLGAWPQNGNPGDDAIRGYGGQFKADINGGNSGISRSNDGGAWQLTSGNSDLHSVALFAGDAILAASDDFTIVCRFNKEALSIFSFGLAADVQGYRPLSQNDCIGLDFQNGDAVDARTDNGGTETLTNVISSGFNGEHDAKIVISGNGTSVAFYVDGTLEGTHTTNIPTATDLYLFMNVSSYGNAYRTCNVIDFFAYREV